MKDHVSSYLDDLVNKSNDDNRLITLETYAKAHQVPIMEPVSMQFLEQLIRIHQPKRILEIGTAIGYSALRMLHAYPGTVVVTIEKDEARYKEAVKNLSTEIKDGKIVVIHGNAIDQLENKANVLGQFDCIFIDAAKGQYKTFFDLVTPLISEEGMIITDNVLFRGYVYEPELTPKRFSSMVKKIRDFNEYISRHPYFLTSIVPIGDGVAISTKINEEEIEHETNAK